LRSILNAAPVASRKSRFLIYLAVAILIAACTPLGKLIVHQGTAQLKPVEAPPPPQSPHVLIFALDGVGYDQFTEATRPGASPNVDALLGKATGGGGLFEHGYSIPNAVSVLPSTTIDAWTAIFTGAPPAFNGITGNEWFQRETMTFYAPAPVSLPKLGGQTMEVYSEDLIGKQIKVPTLFEKVKGPSFVSLNGVYRGANIFTSVDVSSFSSLATSYLESEIGDDTADEQKAYAKMDLESIPLIINAIEKNGVPKVQVVYFPGIDLYTHIASNALHDQVDYFKSVLNPSIGQVIEEYRKQGALDSTFIIFVSDHGHTPVLKDDKHALGAKPTGRAAHVLTRLGFRLRPLEVEPNATDYTATLAYQGAIAYVYLANRAICPAGQKCDWSKPPSFKQDVLPVARAFYRANQTGDRARGLRGTIDLVFAREPRPTGTDSLPYEVFDGHRLVSIEQYLKLHPRPDFIQLERRMRWLSAGPWGNHAGDVLLLSKSGLNRPIEDRYYFSRPYNSWHGSPSLQDSHITFAIANAKSSGAALKDIIAQIGDSEPSQLDLTPLVLKLLKQQSQPDGAAAQSLGKGPVNEAR
jgi:type I phosphodiesterase/nucleotide pyrophosphatase